MKMCTLPSLATRSLAGSPPPKPVDSTQHAIPKPMSRPSSVRSGISPTWSSASWTLCGRGAVFASTRDPLCRTLQAPRGKRGQHLLREWAALGAETAADVLGDDADLGVVEAERAGDGFADAEHVLRGRPDFDTARF